MQAESVPSYDRKDGKKIHTQTLAAMNPNARNYEDLMTVVERLNIPYKEKEETFRRTVFNILATNVDAHIRNFSFMMEEGGDWHITPAYDLTFSCFNPGNKFDPAHYLRIGGKTVDIGYEDLMEFGRRFSIANPNEIIQRTADCVAKFRSVAGDIGVEHQYAGLAYTSTQAWHTPVRRPSIHQYFGQRTSVLRPAYQRTQAEVLPQGQGMSSI